jgi:hypothetical protein
MVIAQNDMIYKIATAPKEDIMKRTVLVALLLLIGIALAFPQPGYSWGHRWHGPGAVVVGAGAAVLGAVIGGPGYGYYGPPGAYAPPAPAYGYAPPVYAYPAPAYAYPAYGPRYYPGYRSHGYYGGRGHYGHRW